MRPLVLSAVRFGALLCALAGAAAAQVPFSLVQPKDGKPAVQISAQELAELGDPLFRLALKDHASEGSLNALIALLGGEADAKPRIFAVHENIADAAKAEERRDGERRVVMGFEGSAGPGGEKLARNVFFSFVIGAAGWRDRPGGLEAIGWDQARGRYNYYRLDNNAWRLRATSVDADLKTPLEREGTCLRCHVNGGLVMKELFLPWNHWHSSETQGDITRYLAGVDPTNWPVTVDDNFAKRLDVAGKLENQVMDANRRFNRKRLAAMLARNGAGLEEVTERDGKSFGKVAQGKRLLRPLFKTGEFNLTSARELSGRHRPEGRDDSDPAKLIGIPATFFLNALLIGGGDSPGFAGLGVPKVRELPDIVALTAGVYRQLVDSKQVKWGGKPGDVHSAWLTPEPSFIENDLLNLALLKGIVTPHFLAATLAVDLERPVVSARREQLKDFVPDEFPYLILPEGTDIPSLPRDAANDELTRLVIAKLEAAHPAPGSPGAEWLDNLKAPDAVALLRDRIDKLNADTRTRASTDAGRTKLLEELFARLIEVRQAVRNDPVVGNLDETADGRLLPVP